MSDIAKAYVQIIPTAEGIKGSLNNMLSGEASAAGKSAGSKIGDGVKGALAGVAKVAAGSVAATSTAVGALAKNSVEAYANYEQLKGGVETLFGSSATTVLRNAEKAYKTAGKSMNDYMETSIQSAASLISSLDGDTAKAAELMDLSIIDMSDNVNKMGTTMEAVQNAYRGFSRGNFTMLDNLALGFAGTKEGMQELLDKAKELSGVEYNIDSYSDIIQAIHVIQDDMGIVNTTLQEGTDTISGSTANLRAAWENLIAGFAKSDANLDQLINDVVEGADTVIQNMQPIIEKALIGISSFIGKAAPIIAEELPNLIRNAFPPLLDASVEVVNALITSLPDIIEALVDVLPEALIKLINTLSENADELADGAVRVVEAITNGIIDNLDVLVPAAVELLAALATALLDHVDELTVVAVKLVTALADAIVDAREELALVAPDLLWALCEGITDSFIQVDNLGYETVSRFIDAIQTCVPNLIPAGWDFVINLIQGIVEHFDDLVNAGEDGVNKVGEGIQKAVTDKASGWGEDLITAFVKGIELKHPILSAAINKVTGTIYGQLHHSHPDYGLLADDYKWMPDMIDSFASGINDNTWKLGTAVESMAGDIYNAMPNVTRVVRNNVPNNEVSPAGFGDLTIPVYIAGRHFETAVVRAEQASNYRRGGR